jgi:AmiR/NasT family two-component response regulator
MVGRRLLPASTSPDYRQLGIPNPNPAAYTGITSNPQYHKTGAPLPSLETPMERPFLFDTGRVAMWQRIRSLFAPAPPEPSQASRSRITIVSLLLEDRDRSLIAEVCHQNQWDVFFAKTCTEGRRVSEQVKPHIILLDRDLADGDWRNALSACASFCAGTCPMLISRVVDDYLWNEVVSNGGHDVLPKPLRRQDVLRAVKFAWSYWNSARQAAVSPNKRLER